MIIYFLFFFPLFLLKKEVGFGATPQENPKKTPRKERAKMFLHVGNNRNIMLKEIVGVFDLDTSTVSADTKRFLKESEKNGTTENAVLELPKSFVLTDNGKVIFSQISTASLMGRV